MIIREHRKLDLKVTNQKSIRCHHLKIVVMLSIQLIKRLW